MIDYHMARLNSNDESIEDIQKHTPTYLCYSMMFSPSNACERAFVFSLWLAVYTSAIF